MLADFVPDKEFLLLAIIFQCARFENQRWVRARRHGFKGSSERFGQFVDNTMMVGRGAAILIVVFHLIAYGWQKTVGLIVLTVLAGWVWAALGSFVAMALGAQALWAIGTALVYISGFILLFVLFTLAFLTK